MTFDLALKVPAGSPVALEQVCAISMLWENIQRFRIEQPCIHWTMFDSDFEYFVVSGAWTVKIVPRSECSYIDFSTWRHAVTAQFKSLRVPAMCWMRSWKSKLWAADKCALLLVCLVRTNFKRLWIPSTPMSDTVRECPKNGIEFLYSSSRLWVFDLYKVP